MGFYAEFIKQLNEKDAKYNASDKGAYVLVPLTYGIHYEIRKEVRGSENFEIRVDFEMPSAEANQIASQKFQAFCQKEDIPIEEAFSGARNGEWQRVVIFRDKTKKITVEDTVKKFADLYEKTEKELKNLLRSAAPFVTANVAKIVKANEKDSENYWKYSAYFMAFIGVVFVAYQSDLLRCRPLLRWSVSILAATTAFIWYLTVRGAEYLRKMLNDSIQSQNNIDCSDEERNIGTPFWRILAGRKYSLPRANALIAFGTALACNIFAIIEATCKMPIVRCIGWLNTLITIVILIMVQF